MTTGRKNGAPHRLLRLPPGIEVNARQVMGGVTLLDALPDGCAALVIFDPQYRSVLDRQKYGNEGSRQKGRAGLPAMAESTIRHFVQEAARVLKPAGYLALWVDAYCVGEAVHHRWMRGCGLQRVGLFHWDKTMFGMGARFRLQSEYLVLAQKEPLRAKSTFTDRSFPDTLPESSDRARHPHAKPMGITLRLIKATTRRGELVVDPAAGSYTVLDACLISGRIFVGCDLRE